MNTTAKIIASTPPAIAMTIGGAGLIAQMPYSGWIFSSGVGLQVLYLYFKRKR